MEYYFAENNDSVDLTAMPFKKVILPASDENPFSNPKIYTPNLNVFSRYTYTHTHTYPRTIFHSALQ